MEKSYINTTAVSFLQIKRNELDNETVKKMEEGKLRLDDAVFYIKKNITGLSGEQELITASINERRGTTNIDKASLPPLVNLILQSIKIGYASHAEENDPSKMRYKSVQTDEIDTAFLHAHLVLKQDDTTIVELPVYSFLSEKDTDKYSIFTGVELKNWRLIKQARQFSINLRFPEGQAVDTSKKHHIEVQLIGDVTRIK
jgi:hypothetical protein